MRSDGCRHCGRSVRSSFPRTYCRPLAQRNSPTSFAVPRSSPAYACPTRSSRRWSRIPETERHSRSSRSFCVRCRKASAAAESSHCSSIKPWVASRKRSARRRTAPWLRRPLKTASVPRRSSNRSPISSPWTMPAGRCAGAGASTQETAFSRSSRRSSIGGCWRFGLKTRARSSTWRTRPSSRHGARSRRLLRHSTRFSSCADRSNATLPHGSVPAGTVPTCGLAPARRRSRRPSPNCQCWSGIFSTPRAIWPGCKPVHEPI